MLNTDIMQMHQTTAKHSILIIGINNQKNLCINCVTKFFNQNFSFEILRYRSN